MTPAQRHGEFIADPAATLEDLPTFVGIGTYCGIRQKPCAGTSSAELNFAERFW
jgi:hypothetical protein